MTATKNAGTAGEAAASPEAPRAGLPRPGDYVPSHEGETARDRRDVLARQLWALTAALYGEGGDEFRACSAEIQDGVMWLINDLALQIRDLCEGGSA
jgi:hypothetical protein